MRAVPYAWLQLSNDKLKLLAAIGGIGFAVMLVFMQLGLRAALFDSAVRLHRAMDYDLIMVSPRTAFLASTQSFSRHRLYTILGLSEVQSVSALYVGLARYFYEGSPDLHRNVLVIGLDPMDRSLRLPGLAEHLDELRLPDVVVMDQYSRVEFQPAIAARRSGKDVELRLNDRHTWLVGLFALGTSFGVDASLITSDLNFRRIFPTRDAGLIELGLIELAPGSDATAVQAMIRKAIPADVLVLTREEYVAREVAYWNGSTPIGYVFTLGAIIGVLVGLIIVYQILFSDVQSHLAEYATLKAMGYTHGYLRNLVFKEALILSILGFIPAFGFSLALYNQAADATQLPMSMTLERTLAVFAMTLVMCAFSGLLAIRKLKGLDPAEVF
jgi:putative ABC transport system permease protein